MTNTLLISCSLIPVPELIISSMTFFHSNVPKKKDFPELITAQWETFENHSQGIFRLFFPIEDGDWEKESAEKY